jgi:hypothetical protein
MAAGRCWRSQISRLGLWRFQFPSVRKQFFLRGFAFHRAPIGIFSIGIFIQGCYVSGKTAPEDAPGRSSGHFHYRGWRRCGRHRRRTSGRGDQPRLVQSPSSPGLLSARHGPDRDLRHLHGGAGRKTGSSVLKESSRRDECCYRSERADMAQREAFDRILQNHDLYCTVCDNNNGNCTVHNTVEHLSVKHQSRPFRGKPY